MRIEDTIFSGKDITITADGGVVIKKITPEFTEEECPGHVASVLDPKVCGRCGIHIDSLRPDDDCNI